MQFHRKPTFPYLSPPRRVLFVRLSSPGNVVYSLPLLGAVRLRFPNAKIAWLLEENSTDLLNGHWANDHLILVPKGWLRSFRAITQLRNRLRGFKPDWTIDVQGLFKSAFAAWLSGAKHRIGFGGIEAREGSWLFNNVRVVPTEEHLIDRNFQLLEPFGIVGGSILFDLPGCTIDALIAEQTIHSLGLHGSFVVLSPGAPFASQIWPEARWAMIARYLKEQWNLPSLVVYENEIDCIRAQSVVDQSAQTAILAPQQSLLQLTTLFRRATLFIGGDSNLLQIAAASQVPCLGLFGPTLARRNGPYGDQHAVLQGGTPGKRTRPRRATQEFILQIGIDDVVNACDRLLSSISERYHSTEQGSMGQRRSSPVPESSVFSEPRKVA